MALSPHTCYNLTRFHGDNGIADDQYRVGGGLAPSVLPHHRAYGSVPRRFTEYIGVA